MFYDHDSQKLNINSIYFGIHNDYLNKHRTLAYNIIIVPNLRCIYDSKIKKLLNIPENASNTYKELRRFCKERQILIAIVDVTCQINTQDEEQQSFLRLVAQNCKYHVKFLKYLHELEDRSNYKFNILTWTDQLNDEESLNNFCAKSWDLFYWNKANM